MRQTPGYRSSKRTLEKLAQGHIIFEGPSAELGAWDRFRIGNLALAAERRGTASSSGLARALSAIPDLARWTKQEKLDIAKIMRAKESGSEARYLHLMQRHARLRAALLALGSTAARQHGRRPFSES